jgi:ligand-binding SRPBCC domain-containing protein
MYYFTRSIEIDADLDAVFAFHTDPANLPRITPCFLRVRILRHDPPAENAEVELHVRPFGLFAQHWHLRFDQYDPPRRLGDIMLSGPFPKWHQTREFIPLRNGHCLLNDSVEYSLPFGALGRVAHSLFVARLIRLMFASRQNKTKKVLETK